MAKITNHSYKWYIVLHTTKENKEIINNQVFDTIGEAGQLLEYLLENPNNNRNEFEIGTITMY